MTTEPYEKYVCKPGELPIKYLHQTEFWLAPDGFERRIDQMPPGKIIWTLDYILANARMIRDAWMVESALEYNPDQRARRWMLDRPVVLALMKQLVMPVPSLREQRFEAALKEVAANSASPWGSGIIAAEALRD